MIIMYRSGHKRASSKQLNPFNFRFFYLQPKCTHYSIVSHFLLLLTTVEVSSVCNNDSCMKKESSIGMDLLRSTEAKWKSYTSKHACNNTYSQMLVCFTVHRPYIVLLVGACYYIDDSSCRHRYDTTQGFKHGKDMYFSINKRHGLHNMHNSYK